MTNGHLFEKTFKQSHIQYAIRTLRPHDWPAIETIYQVGIDSKLATFETHVPTWEVWTQKFRPECRLVMEYESEVVGWATLMSVSARACYAGVCELTIYLAPATQGQGIGKRLLTTLIHESEKAGIWTLQGSIFAHNKASIALHTACGFRRVGHRERISQLDGQWIDTVMVERRSLVMGVD